MRLETGRFEPEQMPDKYAEALRELLGAKVAAGTSNRCCD
jgi:non-homologous end joining protein Ku